jgi:alpha-methylacyl-CoA racemase
MATGFWKERRGSNLLDSGAPFYDTYETADGGHVAVACLEPQFFAEFARLLPLEERFAGAQYDRSQWEAMRSAIAMRFAEKTRDEWAAIFEPSDACVAPVLSFSEARQHPHNRARRTHVEAGAMTRPAPAPRFSRTPSHAAGPATEASDLTAFGIDEKERKRLIEASVIA